MCKNCRRKTSTKEPNGKLGIWKVNIKVNLTKLGMKMRSGFI